MKTAVLLAAVSLPLAGCLSDADLYGDGKFAYTADELYPIAVKKPCGKYWPNIASDASNRMGPNHGCAVHANIRAMVANPRVLTRPGRLGATPAAPAVGAVSFYENTLGGGGGTTYGGTATGGGTTSGTGGSTTP